MKPSLTVLHIISAGVQVYPDWFCGKDVQQITGIPSNCIYPVLREMKAAGWLEWKRELGSPEGLGRPVKNLYRPTDKGIRLSQEIVNKLQPIRYAISAPLLDA